MVKLKIQFNQVIRQVKDPLDRSILRVRYLQGKNWAEICSAVNIGHTGVFNRTSKALTLITLPEDAVDLSQKPTPAVGS